MILKHNNGPSVFQNLSTKYVIVIVVILSSTLSIAAYFDYRAQKKQFTEQLISKGAMLGNFVALVSPDAILGYDFVLMDVYMQEITQRQDVVYSVVVSPENINITSHYDKNNLRFEKYQENQILEILKQLKTEPDIINLEFPIKEDGELYGTLLLGLSTKRIDNISKQAFLERLTKDTVIILILSLSIIIVFRYIALRPIKSLINSSQKIAGGDLDHTAQVLANDELGGLTQSFNNMTNSLRISYVELNKKNQELVAANKAKSVFLANMSHEIRTPLTAIIGFAELILDENIPELDKKHSVNTIIRNGYHLKNVINDILDISKIEAGKLDIEFYEASPIAIVKDIENLVKIQANGKSLDFEIKYEYPLPKTILTDALRLKQILINLTGNAIKFTKVGKIRIEVSCDFSAESINFNVIDSGIGLSEDQQLSVFEVFTQADASTTREYGGTGLGLPLSKRLSEMLGGGIGVSSQLGAGSTFSFHVSTGDLSKVEKVESDSNTACTSTDNFTRATFSHSNTKMLVVENDALNRDSVSLIKGQTGSEGMAANNDKVMGKGGVKKLHGHVLLAEDTLDNQRLIRMYANKLGLALTIVENGEEAVAATLNTQYDLILMDMQMPVMGGLDAIKILLENNCLSPIIAITANALKHDQQKYRESGCVDVIAKPISQNKFQQTLGKYLKHTENHSTIESSPLKQFSEEGSQESKNDNLGQATNTSPENLHVISSQLDIDSEEMAETLEMFLNGLLPMQQLINDFYNKESWDELKAQIHQVKGTGGAFGFPLLTEVAREIHLELSNKKYANLSKLMSELNNIYERIEAGRHAA